MPVLARLAGLLAALVACGPVLAQTGALHVRVVSAADGEPIAGATVRLTSVQALVAPTAAVSGAAGLVEFPVLRAGGGYELEVGAAGYSPTSVEDVRVGIGRPTVILVRLSAELQESVAVTARSDVVDLDDSSSTSRFTGEFLDELPVQGRVFQEVLTFAPGVLDADEDGNPNVHGARATDFTTVVNGVSNADPLTGEWMSHIPLEAVEEMAIVTTGAGARFGRAQGGVADVLLRQGSDEHEGTIGMIWGSSKLDRNGAGNLREQEFSLVQPSLHLSGPIVRGRAWYRATHLLVDRDEPVNVLSQVAITRRDQQIHSDQLTWQISPRNKLSLHFLRDPLVRDNIGVSSSVPAAAARRLERGGDTWTLTWTAPLSTRVLFDTIVAYQDHRQNTLPSQPGVPNDCIRSPRFPTLAFGQCDNLLTGTISGSSSLDSRDHRQRLTVRSDTDVYVRRWLGAPHQLKAGFSVENERYFRRLDRGFDMVFFKGLFESATAHAEVRLSVPRQTEAKAVGTSWAVFVEDQIRPLPNLSVQLGLRYDHEIIDSDGVALFDPAAESRRFQELLAQGMDPPAAAREAFTSYEGFGDYMTALEQVLGAPPASLPSLTPLAQLSQHWSRHRTLRNQRIENRNVSPRIAIAWDPFSDGKTKISASAGRYYDKIFLSVPLLGLEPATSAFTVDAFRNGDTYQEYAVGNVDPTFTVTMIDPDLRVPYQDELTLRLERELAAETAVSLTLVRRRFRDQLQDVDLNHLPADFGRCVVPRDFSTPALLPSPGYGHSVLDPYTGLLYVDTDPGVGDGRLDDCTGFLRQLSAIDAPTAHRPDGLPDLYVMNPGWGEVLLLGNFNTAEYEGAVVEVVRRRFRNWEMNASYTWSRARGDAESYNQLLGNDRSLLEDERGFLSYDQRHVAKVTAVTITPWGFRLGGAVRWESGLPYSIVNVRSSFYATPPVYQGLVPPVTRVRYEYAGSERNDQRNVSFWTFDVRLSKEIPLGGRRMLSLTAEVFNLLNEGTLRIHEQQEDRSSSTRRFGRQFQVGARFSF